MLAVYSLVSAKAHSRLVLSGAQGRLLAALIFVCGVTMPDRTALFIDGAYLDHVVAEVSRGAKIDYAMLTGHISNGLDVLRTYYYHCPPYQGSPPTEDQRKRYSDARRFYTALERLPKFAVRLGRLEYRGDYPAGTPRYEQKRVDILLAVDLTQLAAKGQIQRAILVAGDSDFIPAIEVAKNEGVVVTLYHGSSYHSDLWQSADERYLIDRAMIDSIQRNSGAQSRE